MISLADHLMDPVSGYKTSQRERLHQISHQAILAEEAARGAAVAVVTHDTEAIEVADTTVRLVEGVRVQ